MHIETKNRTSLRGSEESEQSDISKQNSVREKVARYSQAWDIFSVEEKTQALRFCKSTAKT